MANEAYGLWDTNREIKDPGASGTITVDRGISYCGLRTAAAESRTLAAPTKRGDVITLAFEVDTGDCTVTVTNGASGFGTLTFANVGEFATLVSVYNGTAYAWRVVGVTSGIAS